MLVASLALVASLLLAVFPLAVFRVLELFQALELSLSELSALVVFLVLAVFLSLAVSLLVVFRAPGLSQTSKVFLAQMASSLLAASQALELCQVLEVSPWSEAFPVLAVH